MREQARFTREAAREQQRQQKTWADIDHIQILDSSIQITKKPAGMVWFNLSAASTPNLAFLAALLNTIHVPVAQHRWHVPAERDSA